MIVASNDEIVLTLYTAGEIAAAVITGIILIIIGLSVILAIVITLKFRNDRHQCVKQGLKSEIR